MNIQGVQIRADIIGDVGDADSQHVVLVIEDSWTDDDGSDWLVVRDGDTSYGVPLADFEAALSVARSIRAHERSGTEATP